jgi:hypothetical protein
MSAFCSLAAGVSWGQTIISTPAPATQSSQLLQAATAAVQTPSAVVVHVPEGTEFRIRFNDHVSSATASVGDRFSITLEEPVTLSDGTIIPAGYRGVGEVTTAEHKGMMGKPGQLNVRIDYISVGDTRVHLRAAKGQEGQDGVGATVALTVLFGPLGLIKHGHDVDIQPGQQITAYVDEPADIKGPLAKPPAS